MSLPADYLRYPWRRRGLDHEWFEYRSLPRSRPVMWPGGRRLALFVMVHVEHFPLDMTGKPIMPIGGMRYIPDFHGYTNRDYGNRIGIYRIMGLLDRLGVKATAAINSDVARRYPRLIDEIVGRGWEVMASGVNMARLHHGGLARADEDALVGETATTLREASAGQVVRGWHSPAYSASMHTLELVAAHGFDYVADWINDDLPYPMTTKAGPLHSLPGGFEWSDAKILIQNDRAIEDYEAQVTSAMRLLEGEATAEGGRVLPLPLHPWVIGQPHRIRGLERVLGTILSSPVVWPATGSEILDAYRGQT
jgi:allantoinase